MDTSAKPGWSDFAAAVLIAVYIAAVLWITLLSRLGTVTTRILYPFQSYVMIAKGNWGSILQNAANIAMFLPLGVFLRCCGMKGIKKAAFIGFACSAFIELSQLIFHLGTFEADDLLHNTLGAVIGFWLMAKLPRLRNMQVSRKAISCALALSILFSCVPFGCQTYRRQQMIHYASLYTREDGAENLLVLKGKRGYAWNTGVFVSYDRTGRIHIKGKSDKTSWWPIADITLPKGTYTFSGLSGVEKRTVGLVIETNNSRIIDDVGPVDSISFTLEKETDLKVYVIVYPGCDCDVIAAPVIYQEE